MRVLLLLCFASAAFAQSPGLRLARVVNGLTSPLAIAFVPDGSGRMLVLEQAGRIRLVKNGSLVDRAFLDWRSRVSSGGERGLLGIALPPGFAQKRYFYINYTNPQGDTVVSRIRMSADPDLADAASEQVLLTLAQPFSNHNGGNLVFSPKDGYLYIGTGDGGSGGDPNNNAQNPNSLLGKMLRIDVESGQNPYRVPSDNPFVGRQGSRPEIWAVGLRNPWRYSFDRQTNDLWIGDVGQNRAEEVDKQLASSTGGENYGWRTTEGLQCYTPASGCNMQGLVPPVLEYGRSLGNSITGGYVYRGARYPNLNGRYFYADFGTGIIWGFFSPAFQDLRIDSGFSISTFGEDENGELYVADYGGGGIYLMTAARPSATAEGVVNAASFGPGVVPGSLATAFGVGIAALPGIVGAERIPLPADLAGVSITLNNIRAPLIATAIRNGQEQINFQVPWELAGSSQATMVISANGQMSDPVQIALSHAQPEIFAFTRSGNSLTLWATGLGPVNNAPASGDKPAGLSTTTGTTEVSIGGVSVPVTFSGLAPNYVGLYQVNVTAEPNLSGDVVIRVNGVASKPFPLNSPAA